MFLQGVELPYSYLDSIVAAAGLTRSMTLDEATERMRGPPFKNDIMAWALARIAEVCRQNGIRPVLVFTTTPGVLIHDEVAGLFAAARDAGFLVVDIGDAFDGHSDAELSVAPWDSHPNAFAHRLIANRLYAELVNGGVLEQLGAPR